MNRRIWTTAAMISASIVPLLLLRDDGAAEPRAFAIENVRDVTNRLYDPADAERAVVSLLPNHATLLGYPCNLDNCQEMHQITPGSLRTTSPNNVEYGADAGPGQSGGPWVQNFGVPDSRWVDIYNTVCGHRAGNC